MVSVIVIFQLGVAFFLAYPVGFGHFPDAFIKVGVQVFFRDAADVCVAEVHRDVVEIVESAEDAELAEFGDSGQESEADFSVAGLHDAVEALQAAAVSIPEGFVAGRVQKRLVVLVYQDGHRSAGLFVGGVNDSLKPEIGFGIPGLHADCFFPLAQMHIQDHVQIFGLVVGFPAQIQMQHRVFRPVFFQILDGQSLE